MANDLNTNSQAYQDAYQQLASQQSGLGSSDRAGLTNRFQSVIQDAVSQFSNLVGRAPNQAEIDQLISGAVAPAILNSPNGRSEANLTDVNSQLNQFIGQNFQNQAKDYATQQLTAQQGQANSLADLFRTQGNQALSATESSLMDYQSKLFDKLRPNLITSLSAQGLLDTGGLNQAIAGSQADLANSVQPWLAQQKLGIDQGANQIAFSGAAAPMQYQQQNIMNQVPYLQGQGQNALNQNYNTFLTNLNYQNQLGLMAQQQKYTQENQPSFLRTFSQSTANSLGNNLGQWAGPGSSQGQGGSAGMPGGMAGMKQLFATGAM